MEPTVAYPVFGGVVLVVVLTALLVRHFKRGSKHRLTTPALVERARDMSNALADFANEREAAPAGGHDLHQDRPGLYDAESRSAYARDYLPEIEVLREEFAKRGVREKTLDKAYRKPDDTADVRTVSTALLVMAQRLR